MLTIEPKLASLQHSEIKVPFLKGVLSANYQKLNDAKKIYEFILPANLSAELKLLLHPGEMIKLNGASADMTFPTIRLSPGKTKWKFLSTHFNDTGKSMRQKTSIEMDLYLVLRGESRH